MKKKYYLSLATGIISGIMALGYAAIVLRSIISMSEVTKVIQDISDELFGLNLVSYAMVSFITAILGIAISAALAGYRATLAYFYIRVALSDETFFEERKKEYYTFAIFSAVMFAVLLVAYFALEGRIETSITDALISFIVAYGLCIVLPIVERQITLSLKSKKKTQKVVSAEEFDKAKIAAELDSEFVDPTPEKDDGKSDNAE